MIQRIKWTDILQDQEKGFKVEGEIKKICIKTKEDLSNVFINIRTSDYEQLFSGYVKEGQIIYPRIVVNEENVISTHDVIVFGAVGIQISGMQEGQRVDEILIFYDTTTDDRGMV